MAVFPRKEASSRLVLRVDHDRWGQSVADLRHLALNASHPRSRERFLALHDIAQGSCATEVAERTGRRPQSVMDWLHAYNDHGPGALVYQRTGGRPPFAQPSRPRSAKKFVRPGRKRPAHP
jgi:Winged helix-turn helix